MGLTLFFELVLLATLMFLVAIVSYKMLRSKIKNIINRYFRTHYDYALVETASFEKAIAMFNLEEEAAKNGKSSIFHVNGGYMYDVFVRQLLDKGCLLSIEHSSCSVEDKSCTYIIKVIDKHGSTGFIKTNTMLQEFKASSDGFEYYKSSNGTFMIEDYLVDDNQFISARHTEAIVGSAADSLKEDIQDSLAYASIDRNYRMDQDKYVTYYQLKPTMDGLTLSPVMTHLLKADEAMMNVNYSDLKFKFDNKELMVSPFKAANAIARMLYHGQNVGLKGPYGTGKSHFKSMITSILTDDPSVIVITCGADVLKSLIGLTGKSMFLNALSGFEGQRIVFLIDEAEVMMYQPTKDVHTDDNTMLLTLLDGELKQALNSACLLIYNANNDTLNPAFFRHGRLGGNVFEMNPLNKERADKLVEKLKVTIGKKFTFDYGKYIDLVEKDNIINGYTYAKAGYITTAEVVSCFIPVEVTTILHDELKALLSPQETINIKEIFGRESKKTEVVESVSTVQDLEPVSDLPGVGMSRQERRKYSRKKNNKRWYKQSN